uniref:EF-hand domain-containing protein n=1 Tax=Plectus sambesii TaxID=2011161 RepID=A0A914WT93_9BILA
MSSQAFLRKKWERVFYTFFDINRNRKIDWNDFEITFEKIKDLRGEDSAEYRIAKEAMGMVWNGLLQNTKGLDIMAQIPADSEITIEEWVTIWKSYNPKHMHMWQWEYLKYMFFLLDKTGDKFIDNEEYRDVMQIYGMSLQDADKAFKMFAVNEKGRRIELIDYGQFVKTWNEYFTSTDERAPGNFLFGPW